VGPRGPLVQKCIPKTSTCPYLIVVLMNFIAVIVSEIIRGSGNYMGNPVEKFVCMK